MGQKEVIQALKNLGGRAFLRELELEYEKLCYPAEYYGENWMKNNTFNGYRTMYIYLTVLRKHGEITRTKVTISEEEYKKERQKRYDELGYATGVLRQKVLITLLSEE